MEPLVTVHLATGAALILAALLVGGWGLLRARRIGGPREPREAAAFAQLLQLSHTLVVATGLLGLALLADGRRPDDPLHARVYGPFMLVAILAAYGYRTASPVRNVRVFAAASLVLVALGLRAFVTGDGVST